MSTLVVAHKSAQTDLCLELKRAYKQSRSIQSLIRRRLRLTSQQAVREYVSSYNQRNTQRLNVDSDIRAQKLKHCSIMDTFPEVIIQIIDKFLDLSLSKHDKITLQTNFAMHYYTGFTIKQHISHITSSYHRWKDCKSWHLISTPCSWRMPCANGFDPQFKYGSCLKLKCVDKNGKNHYYDFDHADYNITISRSHYQDIIHKKEVWGTECDFSGKEYADKFYYKYMGNLISTQLNTRDYFWSDGDDSLEMTFSADIKECHMQKNEFNQCLFIHFLGLICSAQITVVIDNKQMSIMQAAKKRSRTTPIAITHLRIIYICRFIAWCGLLSALVIGSYQIVIACALCILMSKITEIKIHRSIYNQIQQEYDSLEKKIINLYQSIGLSLLIYYGNTKPQPSETDLIKNIIRKKIFKFNRNLVQYHYKIRGWKIDTLYDLWRLVKILLWELLVVSNIIDAYKGGRPYLYGFSFNNKNCLNNNFGDFNRFMLRPFTWKGMVD